MRRGIYQITGDRPLGVVDTLEDRRHVDRVWFLGSHASLDVAEDETRTFEAAGFRLASHRGDHSAWLDEFVRVTPRHRATTA
jgi:hypothetical protein